MTYEELLAKFNANADLLPAQTRADLADLTGTLDSMPDAGELMKFASW